MWGLDRARYVYLTEKDGRIQGGGFDGVIKQGQVHVRKDSLEFIFNDGLISKIKGRRGEVFEYPRDHRGSRAILLPTPCKTISPGPSSVTIKTELGEWEAVGTHWDVPETRTLRLLSGPVKRFAIDHIQKDDAGELRISYSSTQRGSTNEIFSATYDASGPSQLNGVPVKFTYANNGSMTLNRTVHGVKQRFIYDAASYHLAIDWGSAKENFWWVDRRRVPKSLKKYTCKRDSGMTSLTVFRSASGDVLREIQMDGDLAKSIHFGKYTEKGPASRKFFENDELIYESLEGEDGRLVLSRYGDSGPVVDLRKGVTIKY